MTQIRIDAPNRVLFVDDMHDRLEALLDEGVIVTKEVVYAPNALKALDYLQLDRFDVVFLDHDLETYVYEPYCREITGQDVARAIADLPPDFRPRCAIIHSMNPSGARRMETILLQAGIPTHRIPITAMSGWAPMRADDSPPPDVDDVERYG
jgi:hypothetical protein